jgi:TetR/AcrR family transcriptional repressor of nem operon
MDTRTKLLSHAEQFIRTRGFDAFSFGDLANATGIRKASVHYHFATKADLAEALIKSHMEKAGKKLDHISQTYRTGGEQLAVYIDLFHADTQKGQAIGLCVAYISAYDSFEPDVHADVEAVQNLHLRWLEAVFTRAKDDGSIKAVGPPAEAAQAAFSQVLGAQLVARAAGSDQAFDDATALMRRRIPLD